MPYLYFAFYTTFLVYFSIFITFIAYRSNFYIHNNLSM
jgi:hypothetical protein